MYDCDDDDDEDDKLALKSIISIRYTSKQHKIIA